MFNKINFKLINIVLITIILYFIYLTNGLWLSLLSKIYKILLPIIIGFIIAYILYPYLNKIKSYNISNEKAVFIIIFILTAFLITLLIILIPILSNQINSLIDYIIIFIKEIPNLKLGIMQENIINVLNLTLTKYYDYISLYALKTLSTSINFLTNAFFSIVTSIYFLVDMDKIRLNIKKIKNKKIYNYLKILDVEMNKYFSSFFKIIFISFFEYTLIYLLVGHPDFLLLGFLSSIANFIPYFGCIAIEFLAVVTSLTISRTLAIKIIIVTLVSAIFDNYVLDPYIYGKNNQIPSFLVIISIFAFGILFGFIGMVIALPLTIIIINTIKYLKK